MSLITATQIIHQEIILIQTTIITILIHQQEDHQPQQEAVEIPAIQVEVQQLVEEEEEEIKSSL